jgi:15-cis-phytoene desaturase
VRAWAQDELSVLEFMRKYGMPDRINQEVFISMAKALDFIDPDKLSMTVVLTAMNRFLNEDDGLQMAFLDGNQPDRVCAPIKAHVEARGGEVRLNAPVKEILTNDDGTVAGLQMRDGETITADWCAPAHRAQWSALLHHAMYHHPTAARDVQTRWPPRSARRLISASS